MMTKITTLVMGGLVAGFLLLFADPASAWNDGRPRNAQDSFRSRDSSRHRDFHYRAPRFPADRHSTWGWGPPAVRFPVPVYRPVPVPSYSYPDYGYPVPEQGYRGDLYRRLENARRMRAYHLYHGASREQIAFDNMRIARLERELGLIR